MHPTFLSRAAAFAAAVSMAASLAACGAQSAASAQPAASSAAASSAAAAPSAAASPASAAQAGQGGMRGGAQTDKQSDAALQAMIAETLPNFRQLSYTDAETGKTLAYNLYVPADYDASKTYPLVCFIADASSVGQNVTAPLTQGYGGIIWATQSEQAKHESIVLVPAYPETVLDDHNGYVTTDYLEMTVRLLESVESSYSVDPGRVYATGQSMGCMIFMVLAAEHPDLFAAELFVDGQWDITKLAGLESQNCFYFAAQGDSKALAGQKEVMDLLSRDGTAYSSAEWDAGWSAQQLTDAARQLAAQGGAIHCVQWKLGTVLPAGTAAGTDEHMYSFDHAYTVEGVRDWLFSQTKA